MKNDDLFDKKVREIFENSEFPEKAFNKVFDKIDSKKSNIVYLKYVACFSVIALCSILAFAKLNKSENLIANNMDDNIETNIANNTNDKIEINDDNTYTISQNAKILMANSINRPIVQLPNGLNYEKISTIEESDYIAIVKLDKILYGMNYIEKTKSYVYPVTVSNYSVYKTFKGDISGKIKIATDTETLLPIDSYAKGGFKEDAQRLGYNEMTEEERKNTYVKIPTLQNYTKLTEENYYIAYMKYNKDAEMYCIFDYCFFEYNLDTNQIRIPGTENWEDFALKDYNYLFIE